MARAESTQDRGAARLAAGPEIISGPAAAGAPPKQRSARRKRIELAILLGPPLILFIGFVFVPMIFAIWYSLYNWNGYGPLSDFIGLQNYQGVVTGSVFHQALLHNIIIAVLSFMEIEPTYEAVIVLGFISFFFISLLGLLRLMDRPFHVEEHTKDDVSLFLLRRFVDRLDRSSS